MFGIGDVAGDGGHPCHRGELGVGGGEAISPAGIDGERVAPGGEFLGEGEAESL